MNELHQLEMAKFMYLNNNKSLPLPLHTLFTSNADIHEHNTRHHNDIILILEEHIRYHLVLFIGLHHYGTQLRLKLKTPKLLPPSVQS